MVRNNESAVQQLWVKINEWEQQEQRDGAITLQEAEQIKKDIAEAKAEVARLEAEDQVAELQKKVEDESIAFNVAGVDMSELPHEVIKLAEIIVKHDRKRIYAEEMEKADELAKTTRKAFESMAEQRKLDQGNLLKANEELLFANSNYHDLQINFDIAKAELNQALIENDDYKERLRNAATILDEKDEEIKRLNDLVFGYQQAKVNGDKDKHVIDVPADSVTEVQGLVDAIAKKYIKSEPIGSGNYHELTATDGTKEIVHKSELPSIEQQENPSQDNLEPEFASDQLSAASEAAPVEAPKFQTIAAPPLRSGQVQGNTADEGISEEAAITPSQLEDRLERFAQEHGLLKADVA